MERRVRKGVEGWRREREVSEVESCGAVPVRHCLKRARVSELMEEEAVTAAAAGFGKASRDIRKKVLALVWEAAASCKDLGRSFEWGLYIRLDQIAVGNAAITTSTVQLEDLRTFRCYDLIPYLEMK